MDEVESMAVREPLLAKILMLDTVQKDDQKREDFAKVTYGGISKVSLIVQFDIFSQVTYRPQTTNEEWYARRGYQLIKTVDDYYRDPDRNGKVWDTRTVFMRKDIAECQ